MEYKGYTGHAEYDDVAEIIHGQIVGIRDVVTFQGRTVDELRQAFKDSVDDYLAMCAEDGVEPQKPFSGKFNVRLRPEVHRQVSLAAAAKGKSLNAWVAETLERAAGTSS
jgi:predicted HicB family RNase H-like nuclease